MTPAADHTRGTWFRFDGFVLDVAEHSLTCSGREVLLRPKSFDTLAFLLQRQGRLVTKDELLTTVWAGVVVTEGNLTHCIEEIRTAIGDDPRNPRFIQTIPRVGYRFIADVKTHSPAIVEEVDVEEDEYTAVKVRFRDEQQPKPGPQVTTATPLRTPLLRTRQRAIMVGISAGLLVAAVLLYAFLRPGRGDVITSLAVLPFDNLSGMAGEEYFADGLTDALISDIAQFRRLRVISRTSVMQYKLNRKSLGDIGRELNVDAVVEGSVFRAGNRVRITAALISVRGEKRLWTESYESDRRDLLGLIRSMAGTLAREIQIELTAAEQARLMANPSVDVSVYELYLKGRHHWNRRTLDGFRKGIECFERAIAADSNYAAAYVGLADCYNMMGDYDLLPPVVAFPRARAAALQALALDSSLADAHASLGFSAMHFDWDWAEVEREYTRAIALNPNCSNAHHWYALFLTMHGRFGEARDEIRKARSVDPLSLIILANQAWVDYFAGDYQAAVSACKEVLGLDSTFVSAFIKLGWAYEQLGLYDDAEAEFWKAIVLEGDDPNFLLLLARVTALRGDGAAAARSVRQAIHGARHTFVSDYHIAAAYSGMGEKQMTIDRLRKAYAQRSGWLAWLKVDPKFQKLRDEPAFTDLLDTLGLR